MSVTRNGSHRNGIELSNYFNTNLKKPASGKEECFAAFDCDADGGLSFSEFKLICQALFKNEISGEVYEISEEKLKEMFEVFDIKKDGLIDLEEFEVCWSRWINVCTQPKSACLIVDVQNDFISGSLSIKECPAKHDGADVIQPINSLLNHVKFQAVFYTVDWHPENHISFYENLHMREFDDSSPIPKSKAQLYDEVIFKADPPMKQKLWPLHCVQNTWGAELHKDLKLPEDAVRVCKGIDPEADCYSGFTDMKNVNTPLLSLLKERNITDIFVCGLAYDFCVNATARDALINGYRTILIDDCTRGIDLASIEKAKAGIIEGGGVIIDTNQVAAIAEGKDRRPELGFKLAMEIKKSFSLAGVKVNGSS